MIRFQALMEAIQKSIHSAAEAVESAGDKHLAKFFDKIVNEDSQEKQDKSKELSEAINNGDHVKADALLKEINELPSNDEMATEGDAIYRPKMVAMAFPSQGAGGVDSTIVNVPKITLSPVT